MNKPYKKLPGIFGAFNRRVSITTVMAALSTTVALIAGHIIMVSAQLDDKSTLIIVTCLLLLLSWGVAWVIPRALSESLEQHSDLFRALLTSKGYAEKSLQQIQEEESYESETFRQLAENVNEAFWVTDSTGKELQYVSPAFEKIWGKSLEDLEKSGKTWIDTIYVNDRQKVLDILNLEKKVPFDMDYRINRADGNVRWIRNRGFPVRNPTQEVMQFVGIAEDITEQKAVEMAKSEFVSLASHQLRTPLSTLKWAIEVLGESTANFSDTQNRLLKNAQAAMVRMSETINAMLTASRVESDQITPQLHTVNIHQLLHKVLETYNVQAERKTHVITVECTDDLNVITDENMLMEIVSNLVSNAIHYTADGGSITLSATQNAKMQTVTICVKDTGIGVAWEDQPMLFSKLFRGKNAMLVDTNGTGLGLYVTKSLAQALGGKMFFISEENKGSTFSVQIPVSGPKK